MRAMGLRLLGAALLPVLCASAQPVVETMTPRGAQRGTAVRLTLTGERLAQARLLSDIPGGGVPLSPVSAADGGPGESIAWLVEVAEDAPLGAYPLRVETPEGISNVSLFTVGAFPPAAEAESAAQEDEQAPANDFPESAQAVEPPAAIDGRLRGPERDMFRFRAAKGERLVLEVEARRIGSAIDPRLELLDAHGRVLARSADARGLGVDSRLEFEFPADGDYFALVHDERFSKQKADFYRLTIADYVYADGVFPLGWRRGERVRAEFYGGNLGSPAAADVDLTGVETAETWVRVPHSPAKLHFLVGDDPETFEDAAGSMLPEAAVVNGRILRAGEVDRYRLPVAPGEHWSLELRSGELPGSELYGVLTVSHGGEALAVAGRYAGDPRPSVISTTGQTASYPFINLEIPPGVEELTVAVEDLLQRGGPAHGYRLTARRQGPDFLASLDTPFVNIPARGSALVNVTVERRGYRGAIDFYVENPPDDIVVGGGHIPPVSGLGSTQPRFAKGVLTLSAKPAARRGAAPHLVVRARGVRADGGAIERRARGPGLRTAAAGKGRKPITAPWLGYDLPAGVVPEQPAAVEFLTPRALRVVRGGRQHTARWAVHLRGGARLAKPVAVPRSAGSLRLRVDNDKSKALQGEFLIFPHERTGLGTMDFNLTAEVRAGGRTHTVYSAPLEIEVVDGYGLQPADDLQIAAGGSAAWRGSIRRDPEFRQTVKVRAENLPLGAACETAELRGAAEEYRLQCTAAAAAAAGEYEVEIHAESILSDEATTPYAVDPVKTKLTIAR